MDEKRIPSPAELPHILRQRWTNAAGDFRAWRAELREDPSLLWRTTAIRIVLWIVLGVAVLLSLKAGVQSFFPGASDAEIEQATPEATLYVACINPDCLATYDANTPMDFDAWPLVCEKCEKPTVFRSQNCPTCRQRYATAPGTDGECPHCAARAAAQVPVEKPRTRPVDPDDLEDGW